MFALGILAGWCNENTSGGAFAYRFRVSWLAVLYKTKTFFMDVYGCCW